MKIGILFSGGKDSTFAAYMAKKAGYELECLISLESENPESYMFHTPSISRVKIQAEAMNLPLIIHKTKGQKEAELKDLEAAIKEAVRKYKIEGVVSGAVESTYQASRIQRICSQLGVECFNPLWQKDQFELLEDLLKARFEIILTGVFAYPLDEGWVGRRVDKRFIREMKKLNEKLGINPAGEGGEFETLVLACPLFKKRLKVVGKEVSGEGNSWRMEAEVV